MKRFSVCFLAALILFGLFACSVRPPNETEPPATSEAAETETFAATRESETPGETASSAEPDGAPSGMPLLWRVTDPDGHALYLFGTCHVGDENNDAVLERVSSLLETCDALAVEFDVVAYGEDLGQIARDTAQYLLKDGSTAADYMPEDLYTRACELLDRANMRSAFYDRYNLAWWAQLVDTAMLALYSDLSTDKAMDSMLIERAREKGIPVLEAESGSFQMTLLNSFDDELYLLLIEDTLESGTTYGDDLDELYSLWLSGDRDAFWGYLAGEDEEETDPGKYTDEQIALIEDYDRKLLDDRNLGMRDRAVEYLASGDTVFFAVGAAHMANEIGLVRLLTDAGYTVEEVYY